MATSARDDEERIGPHNTQSRSRPQNAKDVNAQSTRGTDVTPALVGRETH